MITRRDFCRWGTDVLGGLFALGLAVPGIAYLLSPLRGRSEAGEYYPLARLSDLTVGVPRGFSILEDWQDAWVTYPREPVGSIWLVRQSEGAQGPVIAYTAECPHLGCAITLAAGGRSFFCPCHQSRFDLQGRPMNAVPPRGMDRLDVQLSADPDPEIRVKFQRFRSTSQEKIPLV
ncbi:MAG TPA: Rieske 2Fe-2S domain-containing protein [Isosphaeraceae bacterium]|nr:Rieske 2Fe-2S domain-containing protein [Isosphaeraceae bacterium]